jgi:hypothetical protein
VLLPELSQLKKLKITTLNQLLTDVFAIILICGIRPILLSLVYSHDIVFDIAEFAKVLKSVIKT